jgi:hypothetical protein
MKRCKRYWLYLTGIRSRASHSGQVIFERYYNETRGFDEDRMQTTVHSPIR